MFIIHDMQEHPLRKRLRSEGNPLVDGETVTFIWEGSSAPHLTDDLHGWQEHPQRLKRLGPGLWACSFQLGLDAYLEYSYYDPKTKTHLRDPFNPRRVSNGLGGANHFLYMPRAAPSPLTGRAAGVRPGTITQHKVSVEGLDERGRRIVYLYRPPVSGPSPLLLVYDGTDYLRRGRIHVIVDNLIAQKRIRPIAMALLGNRRPAGRFMEYACSDGTLAWLKQDVLPLAQRELDPTDERGASGVLGASLGGLMAIYTGLRMPDTFGRIISQSGVFALEGLDCSVVDLIRYAPRPAVRIWMDVGRMESLLEDNRRMQPILRGKGYEVAYRETGGAHNYTSWRNSLGEALEAMFGK
jgi:enterochelin esterase-like enzyme